MKEMLSEILHFFDKRFFIAFFVYVVAVVLIGKFVAEFRESEIFAQTDFAIQKYFFEIRSDFLTPVMKSITFFGSASFVIPAILVILTGLILKKKYLYSVALTLSVLISFINSFLLKNIFARPRPQGHQLVSESGFSFPSMHSIVAVALYGILAYFLIKSFKKRYLKIIVGLAGFIIILAIGTSRVYLGVHWPSDVLGGYILGFFWLGILIYLLEWSNIHIKLKDLFVESDRSDVNNLVGEYLVDMLTGIPSLRFINHRKVFLRDQGKVVGYNIIFNNLRWGYFFVEESEFNGLKTILINYDTDKNSFFTKIIRDHIRYDSKHGEYIGRFNIQLFEKLFFFGYFSLKKYKHT